MKMKMKFVKLLNKILPSKIFILLKMRPRLMFVDIYTARKVRWIWHNVLNGVDYRGDESASLRKAAHIVEKGLQRIDAKPGHSLDVVKKVNHLLQEADENNIKIWAIDILNQHSLLQDNKLIPNINHTKFSNFNFDKCDLIKLIKSRRSHRYFKNDAISKELIENLAEILHWAPNSCNRQTVKIYVTTKKESIEKCLRLNGGATCMNTPPVFISFVSDTRSYILPVEREAAFIDVSLAAQNFMLLAHAQNLGTCVLNWTHASQIEERQLRDELQIPQHELIIFNMILGYPLKNINHSAKKDISKTVTFR